jgi:hypothetical protein
MGRFLPLLMVVLLIGCSQTPGAAPTGAASAAPGSPADAPSSAASPSPSYIGQVQTEACPRDALGNDEFGFIGSAG